MLFYPFLDDKKSENQHEEDDSEDSKRHISITEMKKDIELEQRMDEENKEITIETLQSPSLKYHYEFPLHVFHKEIPIEVNQKWKKKLFETEHLVELINNCNLEWYQRALFKHRFIPILREYKYRYKKYMRLFSISRFIIQLCSLLIPASLSVQPYFTDDDSSSSLPTLYWTTLGLSIGSSFFIIYSQFFQLEKKTALYSKMNQRLINETVHYVELSHKYFDRKYPTHRDQFRKFCYFFENIFMNEIEKEYLLLREAIQSQWRGGVDMSNFMFSKNSQIHANRNFHDDIATTHESKELSPIFNDNNRKQIDVYFYTPTNSKSGSTSNTDPDTDEDIENQNHRS